MAVQTNSKIHVRGSAALHIAYWKLHFDVASYGTEYISQSNYEISIYFVSV